ncbi:ABC transporter permease subunit [Orbaceae bacterium ac157xtp]
MDFIHWIANIPALVSDNCSLLLSGFWLTCKITLTAIIVGIIWGTALALMRLSNNKLLNQFAKLYVNLFRSIPLLLVLTWFYLAFPRLIDYIFNLPPDTDIRIASAMIAFALFESAYYSEIIRAGINAVNKGQYHASFALGMTRRQAMQYIILPQAFKAMRPLLLTQAIILFQDTSLVYTMSLIDLFGAGMDQIGKSYGGTARYSMLIFVAFIYFIISFIASRLVNYFKKG